MTIVHIVGKPRQGKGILATRLALAIADKGLPVDCNYHLRDVSCRVDHPRVNVIDFYELLSFLKRPRCEPPHLLVIDELPGWCDSYVTQAKSSRFATHFLNQSAKLGYDLIFTSQRSMRADINFRELADVRLKAEKDEKRKMFVYKILDVEFTEDDVETGRSVKIPFALAAKWWSRFDTFEAVPPVGLDEILSEMQKHDPKRLDREIDAQVNELIPMWPVGEKPDFYAVQNALIEAGLPTVHARLVSYRLGRLLGKKSILRPQKETLSLPVEVETDRSNCLEGWLRLQNRKG